MRVGAVIGEFPGQAPVMSRLVARLLERLTGGIAALGSEGLEILSVTLLIAATEAFSTGDFHRCKQYCLRGLDVIPTYATSIRPGDFLTILVSCKEQAVVDGLIPALHSAGPGTERSKAEATPLRDLDGTELQIVEFLVRHRQATEMDLRTLLGTRRVVGVMNRLIRKAAAQGRSVRRAVRCFRAPAR